MQVKKRKEKKKVKKNKESFLIKHFHSVWHPFVIEFVHTQKIFLKNARGSLNDIQRK